MPDRDFESVRNKTVTFWKIFLSIALVIVLAAAIFPFRREIAETVVRAGAYLAWSVNLLGGVIPQQILWFFLLLAILYIAVGSFYGKRLELGVARPNPPPLEGPVETLARWIEKRQGGTYFNWQVANLLGRINQHFDESAARGISGRIPPPPPDVQAYLEAGLNTTYADYPMRGIASRKTPTSFDIPLEHVMDYIEEHLEINHERRDQ
jgi:hypothetical protein